MSGFRFRLLDTAGSEVGIVASTVASVGIGETVQMPDGRAVEVVDIYDDEFGQDGGVQATLVVDAGDETRVEPLGEQHAGPFLDLVERLGLGSHRQEIERLVQRVRDDVDEPDDRRDSGSP